MTAETDLLPCPFCGGAPSVRVPEATDGYATHVACRCGASLYGARRHFSSTEEAIAAWNRRTAPPPSVPEDACESRAEGGGE